MSSDDRDLVNLAEVSIIESLYFDHVCVTHKAALLKHCGKLTMQSFIDCFDDDERALWEKPKAA